MKKPEHAGYASDVHYHVGQRVRVSIPEIPPKETDCKEGVIEGIRTAFARSPALRRVNYLVRFDRPVIKAGYVHFEQIHQLWVHADQLTRLT